MSISTAEQLEQNEQYDKAYEEYKQVHAQSPKSIDILERLGHLATILEKKEEAAIYYSKILELDATSVLAYEQLMDIYMADDRYKYYIARGNLHIVQHELSHAISDFKKALDKAQTEEEMSSSRFILATLYEEAGKHHSAIDEYLRILDTAALNEVVYLNLAQIYINEDSLSSAIDTLERAREHNFDTNSIRETLAQLYLKNNQPEKARELTGDELVRVKSLLDEGKNQAAFDILDKIRADYKKIAQFHSLLAQYYYNIKDWDNSLEEVNEFDKFEKNSPLTYQMRALIYEEKGNDFESHINWAKYNISRKDKDVALNEYEQAYQINNSDVILVRNLAELIDDMGDRNHAAEFWERLTQLDSGNRKALEKVADFKESIGDNRGATETLEKLYSLDNRNSIVVKKLAEAYEKIKNKEKSLEYYNRFIAISPVNDDYNQIKQKISKLETIEMVEEEGLLDKLMGLFSRK